MASQAEAAAHLQQQQVAADAPAKQAFQLSFESLKVAVLLQLDAHRMPVQRSGGQGSHLGQHASPKLHLQHLAAAVVGAAGKAICFWGAAVPNLLRYPFEAVPVA